MLDLFLFASFYSVFNKGCVFILYIGFKYVLENAIVLSIPLVFGPRISEFSPEFPIQLVLLIRCATEYQRFSSRKVHFDLISLIYEV